MEKIPPETAVDRMAISPVEVAVEPGDPQPDPRQKEDQEDRDKSSSH
jgi:hypothetical protein